MDSFAQLQEQLLRGGIAPRHVKRYLRELTEHLADLTEAQAAAGFDAEDAAARARAALGPDAELADAMLKQRDFRSLSARFPWLVFGVMPPLAVIASFLVLLPVMIITGHLGGIITSHNKMPLPIPAWFDWTMSGLVFAANFVIGTSLAFLLAWLAERQRLKLLWPLLGMTLILLLGVRGHFHADNKGISFNLFGLFSFYRIFGPPGFHVYWPVLLTQAALLCLPLTWLLRTRRRVEQECV